MIKNLVNCIDPYHRTPDWSPRSCVYNRTFSAPKFFKSLVICWYHLSIPWGYLVITTNMALILPRKWEKCSSPRHGAWKFWCSPNMFAMQFSSILHICQSSSSYSFRERWKHCRPWNSLKKCPGSTSSNLSKSSRYFQQLQHYNNRCPLRKIPHFFFRAIHGNQTRTFWQKERHTDSWIAVISFPQSV